MFCLDICVDNKKLNLSQKLVYFFIFVIARNLTFLIHVENMLNGCRQCDQVSLFVQNLTIWNGQMKHYLNSSTTSTVQIVDEWISRLCVAK